MNKNIIKLFICTLLTLVGGLWGTHFFSTWETLSLPLRDFSSMFMLLGSLFVAGVLIVLLLSKLERQPPVESQ